MSLPRRLRFEILRRDNYTCRYCGAAAPDVTLNVDHVIPVVLGGGDEPSNLVTSCAPCNSGKASIAPDQPLVDDVADDALRWARAMARASIMRREQIAATQETVERFDAAWSTWKTPDGDIPERPQTWPNDIEMFLINGLNLQDLTHFVRVAMNSHVPTNAVWRYFCGCCWRELSNRQELARQELEEGDH